jgi:dihydroorotate dehydrogenase
MTLYKHVFFPILKKFDAEHAHERTLSALAFAQSNTAGRAVLRRLAGELPTQETAVFGLIFPNILGVAAGFDKDVRVAAGLGLLGFGHIEVGTLTPKPQAGNPRPRIFRLPEDEALINRMGFPNGGAATAVPRLKSLAANPHSPIIGVSLGKQKETPLADAADDYLTVMQAVYPYADYLAINISSPNTPGLRDLQGGNYLHHLLHTLMGEKEKLAAETGKKRPLLVKIAPDLTWPELDDILTAVQDTRINGIIAANTTLSRKTLTNPAKKESGGLSGRPLRARSTEIINYIHRHTGGTLPIIGVGGVRSAADVVEKLNAGASLVQLYSSLIYEGPRLAGTILRNLPKV